jgi:hypothetical protein
LLLTSVIAKPPEDIIDEPFLITYSDTSPTWTGSGKVLADMFALDGDVLQQALKEGETQVRQSATPTPAELRDSLHHSLGGMEKDGEVEGRLPKKEAEGVGNGIQGIIQDLPAGIRVSQGGTL